MTTEQATEDIIDLAYWFPRIEAAGLPVPETRVIHTDLDLWPLVDGEPVEGFGNLIAEIRAAADTIGYPCFLRNGHTSGKHSWMKTCYLSDPSLIGQHVFRLVEESACSDIGGFQTWAVRRLIPTTTLFYAFSGMPITREFRLFARDGVVEHIQPYWPIAAIQQSYQTPSRPDWAALLMGASTLRDDERDILTGLAVQASQAVSGYWSVDFLQDRDAEWWLTDMAPGAVSYRWEPTFSLRRDR